VEQTVNEDRTQTASPLVHVAREQLLTRLREAAGLVQEDVAGQLGRVREVLADLADRAAALEVAQEVGSDEQPAGPCSLLACTRLAAAGGEPVREFLLIPFGQVQVERASAGGDFTFTRRHAESAQCWLESIGRKLAIDYEHQSFDRFNTRADGLRPAAGWIGGLEVRDDGLWAIDVTWTERAAELLRSGEYRYFSPVIFWTDEEHSDLAALGPVALTNDPAMRAVPPLAASARGADESVLDDEDDSAEEPADDLSPALAEAEAEITRLRRRLATQEADTFVERGLRQGKILDSTSMDWREDYLRDAAATEERLTRAPVILPPGRVQALDRRDRGGAVANTAREQRREDETFRRWGVTPEDLAAYSRAVAGGRVLLSGIR
jgi:hypothetical protein